MNPPARIVLRAHLALALRLMHLAQAECERLVREYSGYREGRGRRTTASWLRYELRARHAELARASELAEIVIVMIDHFHDRDRRAEVRQELGILADLGPPDFGGDDLARDRAREEARNTVAVWSRVQAVQLAGVRR